MCIYCTFENNSDDAKVSVFDLAEIVNSNLNLIRSILDPLGDVVVKKIGFLQIRFLQK